MDLTDKRFFYPRAYFVGVDLGQSFDPTAIAICERIEAQPGPDVKDKPPPSEYNIRHLERLPLGTPYPAVVGHVLGLLCRDPLATREAMTLVDHTGVGKAVFEMFQAAHIKNLKGITITGGNEVSKTDAGWHVPKLELISRVQAKLHSGQLAIEPTLMDAQALLREFQEFRGTFTSAGNVIFNARQGAHDDLVLATALAIFGATEKTPKASISPLRF